MSGKVQLSPAEMAELSALAFQIAHSDKPGVRDTFANLVRVVDPTKAPAFKDVFLRQEIGKLRQEIEAGRRKDEVDRVVAKFDAQKETVTRKYGYNNDQVAELDKIRTQYGLADWDAAARIYSTYNPPENPELKPPPEILAESTWDFPTVPGPDGKMLEFKDYIKNPRKFSNNTAMQMITEFKRGRLPSAFHRT